MRYFCFTENSPCSETQNKMVFSSKWVELMVCGLDHSGSQPYYNYVMFSCNFVSLAAIPEAIAWQNPNLMLVTTRRGGHIGFIQGWLPFRKTFMDKLLAQFLVAVLQHDCFETTPNPTDSNSDSDHDNDSLHPLIYDRS